MAQGDKFMRFKKIICGMMTAVSCISVMSINASADVIGTAKRETEGGSSGTMEARVIAEKSYLHQQNSIYWENLLVRLKVHHLEMW